jgi:3-oxoacyl-[acyl-carrier protein] reductase
MSAAAKLAVVTGGASGIGAACVRHFAANGWDVCINYFLESEEAAAWNLIAEAGASGQSAIAVRGDVANDADCRAIAAAALNHFGRVDAVVSSAGTTRVVPQANLEGLSLDDFLRTSAVNTAGPFQIVRACAPALKASGDGAVVIVTSYGALTGTGSSMAYAASKGATNTLTLSLARILAPEVRVNAVCPALIADGLIQRLDPEKFEARRQSQIARAPLRRIGRAADVAADVYWLATGASLVTGSVLMLDAGLHLNMDE